MRSLGEVCLLTAFIGSGFAAFVGLVPEARRITWLRRLGQLAALASLVALTFVVGILVWALYRKDFSFAYVVQYSSRDLPWHYSISALWVGQAGSLLLWAWMLGVLAFAFRLLKGRELSELSEPAFGILMGYLSFLVAIMVFAADPMTGNAALRGEGAGLSPLLQHPSMLVHPPIVFLGYSLWTIPFALVTAALLNNQLDRGWVKLARPWALMGWTVLGVGILLGAQWAYEELGWGGYWGWDPVENGSLIPWLTGTALIHAMMAWQHRGALKKTAVALAIATFGLCNFATFLTRSGIFSSLHAFSKSSIGWLFLALMLTLLIGGIVLLWRRRDALRADHPLSHIFSRESFVLLADVALLSLTTVVLIGTLSSALSSAATGKMILVGPDFYNRVLAPIGLLLLLTVSAAPLLRWGKGPSRGQIQALIAAAGLAAAASIGAFLSGARHPLFLAVIAMSALAAASLVFAVVLDAGRRREGVWLLRLWFALSRGRRQYAGFVIHAGFICLALGIAGSSLGKREQDITLRAGEPVTWAGRQVRLLARGERELPDKRIAEAELEILDSGRAVVLAPARHYHLLAKTWTTEVAIDSTWRGDLYAITHGFGSQGQVHLTLVDNPMMRWIWLGGWLAATGTAIRLWPARRRGKAASSRTRGPVLERESGEAAFFRKAA